MTIATITLEHAEAELAAGARSYVYRMLATAFSYPGDAVIEMLASGDWVRQLRSVAQHLPFGVSVLDETLEVDEPDYIRQAFVSTFEVGAGGPYCALYEGSHRSGRMKLMEDLVRFYEHFGLKPEEGDQPDHLCAELEFMHYIAFKEAAALAHGDPVADVRRAQHDFLDRHLCRWLPKFRRRVEGASALPGLYLFATRLAEEFCNRDRAWLREK